MAHKLTKIDNPSGLSRQFTVLATYNLLTEKLGKPTNTAASPDNKVPFEWALRDEKTGREVFLWAYKMSAKAAKRLTEWSAAGSAELLAELFGLDNVVPEGTVNLLEILFGEGNL